MFNYLVTDQEKWLAKARCQSVSGPTLISLMVSVDFKHHIYLLVSDQEFIPLHDCSTIPADCFSDRGQHRT